MLSVGVDVGTTRTKAIAIDWSGDTRAVQTVSTPWLSDRGRRVLSPDLLRSTVDSLIARLLDPLAGERVESVGFTSIAESGFLCTPSGDALLPAAPWSDGGGASAAREFQSDFGSDAFSQVTGLRLSSTPSLFKLRELSRNTKWDRPLRWLSVAEWLAVQFGAGPRAERSLASRTGLVDITRHRMAEDLRDWTGLPLVETDLVWAGDAVGEVHTAGPLKGAIIVIGGHDHLCAVIGAEATAPGDVLNSFGTAEAYIAAVHIASSPSEVLARGHAGMETGYHVVRGAHSLIIGAAHGKQLSEVLERLDEPVSVIEDQYWPSDLEIVPSPDLLSSAAAATWIAVVQATHLKSLEMARVILDNTQVDRVVGTGGWLQSRWVRDLKRRDLPNFIQSSRDETAARGAAVLGAAAVAGRLAAGL